MLCMLESLHVSTTHFFLLNILYMNLKRWQISNKSLTCIKLFMLGIIYVSFVIAWISLIVQLDTLIVPEDYDFDPEPCSPPSSLSIIYMHSWHIQPPVQLRSLSFYTTGPCYGFILVYETIPLIVCFFLLNLLYFILVLVLALYRSCVCSVHSHIVFI